MTGHNCDRTAHWGLSFLALLGMMVATTGSVCARRASARRAPPSATGSVKELLDRAAQEPPAQAKHTVDEAIQLVLKTGDGTNGCGRS